MQFGQTDELMEVKNDNSKQRNPYLKRYRSCKVYVALNYDLSTVTKCMNAEKRDELESVFLCHAMKMFILILTFFLTADISAAVTTLALS